MSRHVFKGAGHTLVLGLDAPLQCFFGQVHSARGSILLGDGEGYLATPGGLRSLLDEASKYELVPPTMCDALERDLEDLGRGSDLSYEKHHSEPQ